MKASIDQVVPGMLGQLERNVTTTRPELKDALHETLLAIEPEFVKTEQSVITDSAKFLASEMTEQELKDVAAFYESPAGKKFIAAEPSLDQEVGNLGARLEPTIVDGHSRPRPRGNEEEGPRFLTARPPIERTPAFPSPSPASAADGRRAFAWRRKAIRGRAGLVARGPAAPPPKICLAWPPVPRSDARFAGRRAMGLRQNARLDPQ